jgi:hypothetical protein
VKLIWRRRRGERDDGILIMATRRISIDDNPATRWPSPDFNLQALRDEGSRIHDEVRYFLLQMSFQGRRMAAARHEL